MILLAELKQVQSGIGVSLLAALEEIHWFTKQIVSKFSHCDDHEVLMSSKNIVDFVSSDEGITLYVSDLIVVKP